ncbi:Calcium-independent receptor for alpha-latrotoxin [Carabus blaptoides fortunei]
MINQVNILVAVLFAVAVSSAYNVENKITCERQPMKLECNKGEVLKIMSANYGRTNANLCEPNGNTNCRASGSLSIIKNKCEGQTSCTVMATNDVFGDPCHGVVKYIEAQYQCVPAPACAANQFRCDDGKCKSKSLLCNGYPDCSGGEDERGCIASTILKDKCDLRRGCSVPSTNEIFGDPCHGVKKYIELNYYCYQIAL